MSGEDSVRATNAQLGEMKRKAQRAHQICNELRLAHPEIPELGDDGVLHDAIHDILRVETPTATVTDLRPMRAAPEAALSVAPSTQPESPK